MKKIFTLILALIMISAAFATVSVSAAEDTVTVSYYSGTADTSWYNASKVEKEYHIKTADEFAGLAQIVRGGQKFSGVNFYLDCDIVWNMGKLTINEYGMPLYNGKPVDDSNKPLDYTPIGNYPESSTANDPGVSGNYFFGNFDGQGHVISGLYVYEPEKSAVGLFTLFCGEYLKNLSIVNSYFGTFARSGSFAGFVYTTKNKGTLTDAATVISGLYSDASVISFNDTDGQNGRLGGIVGLLITNGSAKSGGCTQIMENCWFAGIIQHIVSTRYSGGVLGVIAAGNQSNKVKVQMKNCLMTGAIYMGLDYKEALRVGGILGNVWQGTVTMTNCVSAISDTNVLPNNYFATDNNGKCVFLGCHESTPSNIIYENCHYSPKGSFDHRDAAIQSVETRGVTGTPTKITNISALASALPGEIFDFSEGNLALALRTALAPHEAPEAPEDSDAPETSDTPDTPEAPESSDTDNVTGTDEIPTEGTEPETENGTETEEIPEGEDEPETGVPTEAPSTTEAPKQKGCSGFSAASALALVAIFAAGVVIKKKN